MPQQTLLSSSEVLLYVSHHYSLSASDVQKQIYLQERRAAYSVIGKDFFDTLLVAKQDYSNEPDWIPGNTYNVSDKVWRLGLVYECTANGTTSDPNGGEGWAYAVKFNSGCLDGLWDNGLANFLSNIIFAASVNSVAYKFAPGGIVQINAQDAQQAATDRAQAVATKFREDADAWWELATRYAIDRNDNCNGAFNEFLPVKKHIACTLEGQQAQLSRAKPRYIFMGNNYIHPNNGQW
jgi:hypothetical protein